MGQMDAQDGYDAIEHLAKLPYCNGKIGMAGNSHLAIIQYFIAALKPPSLAAIAPWDGLSDLYREQFVRGGVFTLSNFQLIATLIYKGPNGVEDFDAMYKQDPYATAHFWSDKRVDFTKISIPTFLCGSDVSSLHTMGTLRAWRQINTKDKWLNWGPWQVCLPFFVGRRLPINAKGPSGMVPPIFMPRDTTRSSGLFRSLSQRQAKRLGRKNTSCADVCLELWRH